MLERAFPYAVRGQVYAPSEKVSVVRGSLFVVTGKRVVETRIPQIEKPWVYIAGRWVNIPTAFPYTTSGWHDHADRRVFGTARDNK